MSYPDAEDPSDATSTEHSTRPESRFEVEYVSTFATHSTTTSSTNGGDRSDASYVTQSNITSPLDFLTERNLAVHNAQMDCLSLHIVSGVKRAVGTQVGVKSEPLEKTPAMRLRAARQDLLRRMRQRSMSPDDVEESGGLALVGNKSQPGGYIAGIKTSGSVLYYPGRTRQNSDITCNQSKSISTTTAETLCQRPSMEASEGITVTGTLRKPLEYGYLMQHNTNMAHTTMDTWLDRVLGWAIEQRQVLEDSGCRNSKIMSPQCWVVSRWSSSSLDAEDRELEQDLKEVMESGMPGGPLVRPEEIGKYNVNDLGCRNSKIKSRWSSFYRDGTFGEGGEEFLRSPNDADRESKCVGAIDFSAGAREVLDDEQPIRLRSTSRQGSVSNMYEDFISDDESHRPLKWKSCAKRLGRRLQRAENEMREAMESNVSERPVRSSRRRN